MNSKQMYTHLEVLKKESNESLGFNMQKYHDLYDTDKKEAKLHYSIAMDEITKIGVYGSLIQYIENEVAWEKQVLSQIGSK